MKTLKYRNIIILSFCVAILCSFSLLVMRCVAYKKAVRVMMLEKQLVLLQEVERKADLYIESVIVNPNVKQTDLMSNRIIFAAIGEDASFLYATDKSVAYNNR